MKPISEVLSRIIERISNTNGYKKAWMEKYWEDLVGESAKKHSRPYKIEKEILYVSVDSSVWNQALFIDKANLIRRINQKFARSIIEEVKYQIGQFAVSPIDHVEAEGFLQTMNTILDEQEAISSAQEISEIWNRRVLLSLCNKTKYNSKIKRKYVR
jgi:hypothetical protein